MARRNVISIQNRKVHLVTGTYTQTLNVCTSENATGQYENVLRFQIGHFISPDFVKQQATIAQLISRCADIEDVVVEVPPGKREDEDAHTSVSAALALADAPDDPKWSVTAIDSVERSIEILLREFMEYPYLHRVEHSIHARLYELLRQQAPLSQTTKLRTGEITQLVHKEWPETVPRPDKDGRRGNFDICILSPYRCRTSDARSFCQGKIGPTVAIEVGLNYDANHLSQDAEKMANSQVRHGYLIHLVRGKGHEANIDRIIEKALPNGALKIAYARVDRGRRYLKLPDHENIHSI